MAQDFVADTSTFFLVFLYQQGISSVCGVLHCIEIVESFWTFSLIQFDSEIISGNMLILWVMVQLFLPDAYWKIIGNSAIFCASSSTAAAIFLDRVFVLSVYTLRVHAFKRKSLPEQFLFSILKFKKGLCSRALFNSLLACFDLCCMTNTLVSFGCIMTSSAFY